MIFLLSTRRSWTGFRKKTRSSLRFQLLTLTVPCVTQSEMLTLPSTFRDLSVVSPAAAGAKSGALARLRTGTTAYAFDSRDGLWGIFRMMADAEPRALSTTAVEWKYTRVGSGIDLIVEKVEVPLALKCILIRERHANRTEGLAHHFATLLPSACRK